MIKHFWRASWFYMKHIHNEKKNQLMKTEPELTQMLELA